MTGAANGAGAWSLTDTGPAAHGPRSYTARAVDPAGNASAASSAPPVTVDTSAPAAPSVPRPGRLVGRRRLRHRRPHRRRLPDLHRHRGRRRDRAGAADGSNVASGTAAGGSWTITDAGPAPDGSRGSSARAVDAAGNTADSAALLVTVDTVDPAPAGIPDLDAGSDTGASAMDDIISDTSPSFAGTAGADGVGLVGDGVPLGSSTPAGGTVPLSDPGPALGDPTPTAPSPPAPPATSSSRRR